MPTDLQLLCGVTLKAETRYPGWSRLAKNGWWELETDLFFTSFLELGDVVVDVGANEGITSVLAAKLVGASGAVHAFEPDVELAAITQDHVAINQLANIIVNNIAVGKADGQINMQRTAGAQYGVSAQESVEGSYRVPCITLDGYCETRGIRSVQLLKIDIDGGELDCLVGATKLLQSAEPPAVVVEVSFEHERLGVTANDILQFLRSCGYRFCAARMKFPFVDVIDDDSDFQKLPVDFRKREIANLFCIKPEYHWRRLLKHTWPFPEKLESFQRHYHSDNPFPSAEDFWRAYNEELATFFRQPLSAAIGRTRSRR